MIQTPWGYVVESLPPILSVEQFRELSPGLSSTDERIQTVLDGVSSAVRDACGWHVSPTLDCVYTGRGEGSLLMLPAMGVTAVSKVTVKGVEYAFVWDFTGMVRIEGTFPDEFRSAQCSYTAGIESQSLIQAVAQIAANAIAATPGVNSESAGNVSISYNKTGDGITGGVTLLPRDMALLTPYKLVRAW